MCGIVGIVGQTPVNEALYEALTVLQHRGQDAAGIVTCEANRLHLRKDTGLVRDVFQARHMVSLRGHLGIGHVRYPTAGNPTMAEAQPFYVNSPYGITLSHNGNLINSAALRRDLFREDLRHMNTDSDSEVLLNVLAHELYGRAKLRPEPDDFFAAVTGLHQHCQGAYAVVAMITGQGLLAFRDPYGIRPLVFGQRQTEQGQEYMIASESVALDVLGFKRIRDVAPGEAIFISVQGEVFSKLCSAQTLHSPCIFEFVYLARPDSIIDNISVYKARLRMGEKLAHKLQQAQPAGDIDVVIPIPDTSRTAALQMANALNLTYREGFIKNRYIGRTFIMPGQQERKKSIRQKLNAIELEFRGKNVLLVDDSIVRGNTSRQIIQMARDAGANRVYFASAAPPVRYPNVYGIDMPAREELIACDRDEACVARELGADWLLYQDLPDLVAAVGKGNRAITRFDNSCFDGEYVTGGVTTDYLTHLSQVRNDQSKHQRLKRMEQAVVDLPNQG